MAMAKRQMGCCLVTVVREVPGSTGLRRSRAGDPVLLDASPEGLEESGFQNGVD